MAAEKPSSPKGTRDFTPEEMLKRNGIFQTVREVFELHGYMPIETPAMENITTLLGKYGEEGDKLLFRILNSGNFLENIHPRDLLPENPSPVAMKISEKGLRYDLTVPFARYVVQHQNEITFPFKRYQVQPVWRADKPQKGRYREFFQCDVDVIGSTSLLNEVELVQIISEVFSTLKIGILTRLNHRKILTGIAETCGLSEYFGAFTVALDKLEKIGRENVFKEMIDRGLPESAVARLDPFLEMKGNFREKLDFLKNNLEGSAEGKTGVTELEFLLDALESLGLDRQCDLDLALARGLDYYTGTIIEVISTGISIGSICGGGRYDDLTGIFGMEGISGVGISFGADRIYDVMTALELFPEEGGSFCQVLFINFGEKEARYCLKISDELRRLGISSEVYPDEVKLKKQMKYADQKKIPYVVLVGEDEMNKGTLTLKNMSTGEQQSLTGNQLPGALNKD